jgi:hypothetical protein
MLKHTHDFAQPALPLADDEEPLLPVDQDGVDDDMLLEHSLELAE